MLKTGYDRRMKIAIVGFATDGKVSAAYFSRHGHAVTVCDQDETLEIPAEYTKQLGAAYLDEMDRFDLIVRSSGIHPSVILANNPTVRGKITTSVNEFLRNCPTKHTIGVTGTKGKGTTSTLLTKLLEASGRRVFLGGNIGNSPLEFIDSITPDDWVVLELSSFQLSDLAHSPHIAVCLMVVPEHLNWHSDMNDYKAAKAHLFAQQNSDDVAIYYAQSPDSKEIASHGAAQKVPYYATSGASIENDSVVIDGTRMCHTNELKLLGKHNWQNVCAATTAVWYAGVRDANIIRSVVTTFRGLPHRIEPLRTIGDVTYYNDSFASTPDATIAALEAIPGKKVLIMGGFDRGLPLEHVPKAFIQHAETLRKVMLVGASAKRLAATCDAGGFDGYEVCSEKTMAAIVARATVLAESGDAVVLSPGFASYDMFKNFEDRGEQFRKVVESL